MVHSSPSERDLTPGKLDLPFGFSRYSVAGCRTVSPGAHRLQYVAIAHWPATPQYERAMNTSVRADDEADFHLDRRNHQRIGSGKSLGRLGIFATCPSAHVRHFAELRCSDGSFPEQVFMLTQPRLTKMRGKRLRRRGSRNREDQEKARPESARHLATLKGGEFARICPCAGKLGASSHLS